MTADSSSLEERLREAVALSPSPTVAAQIDERVASAIAAPSPTTARGPLTLFVAITAVASASVLAVVLTGLIRHATPPGGVSGAGATPTAPETQLSDAPASFVNRVPLPPCGEEVRDPADASSPYDLVARHCLVDAFEAGRGAEFIETSVSGGITVQRQWWRVLPGGHVEAFLDLSNLGRVPADGWWRLECPDGLILYSDEQGVFGAGSNDVPCSGEPLDENALWYANGEHGGQD